MPESAPAPEGPQFETAEYKDTPRRDECAFCHQPIAQQYYRVNSAMACASCAEQAGREVPQGRHSDYARALLFGMGAALVGLALYATFGIVTGWVIGYLSLAVGYIVGKSMMKGSRGIGGRKYQITAVLLTYAAVSLAAIPISIAVQIKQKKEQKQTQAEQRQYSTAEPSASTPEAQPKERMNLGMALAYLALLGLASPFLELQDPLQGLIGLVILLVGIRIAWRLTAGGPAVEVSGPYDNAQPA